MISANIKTKLKSYFETPEFKQLLEQLKLKYIHYGDCVGTISVKPKTSKEAEKLSMFLSLNIKENIKTNIKISNIQASLDDSIFEGVLVNDLVFMFYPDIKSNKEIKQETNLYLNEKLKKYQDLYKDYEVISLFTNKEALKKIKYYILNDKVLLDNIFASLIKLPIFSNNSEYLSIFASNITGDPHYYDLDNHNSNTLLQFISFLFDYKYENNRNIKKHIFESVGILIDEVSNYVITYNLSGNDMLNSFKENLTPLTINLSNINKMNDIKVENDTLLIIENPSFISKINNKKLNYSVIITSGNSNLVIYRLLEKISNVNKIYFNGDFDPEGLLIAENLKSRYSNIKFIGYNDKFYLNGISDNTINNSRLKKLNNIYDDDLVVIKELLLNSKVSSYQELNYDMIIDIMNSL